MTEETIFATALERPDPADREAFLDDACAGDPQLRRRVETLLASHETPGFMETPAVRGAVEGFGDETRTGPSAEPAGSLDFLAPSDKPGSLGRLDHYEVMEVIGRGGMGVVLRAFDEKLHRVVAVKVMAPQLATSATARRRFAREARAAAAVRNEHVVAIHGVEDAGPLPYLVMEYVAGPSLQDRIDRDGPLKVAEVLRIGMQAAVGLAAAHAQGLIHRDVKPSNILLENGVERVKLTDFGLARAADDASLTQSGVVTGTPQYMSPEQARGEAVDHRSDLFSLGSVLYAMCTGRPPFRASGTMAVLKRVCEEEPRPIRDSNPETPAWLAPIVARLHAKDPADRFVSAAEVADLLGRHLAHVQQPALVPLPSLPDPYPLPPVKVGKRGAGRRSRWATAATVLVALVAGLGAAEASGLTNVRATVVRVFTPDGTLVVETDDPAVKVTIEGDGDLVITGAGLQEVRLKAGSYRLKATRDGQSVKLDRDLVTIARGDRQVVRVRVEGEPAPLAAVAPKAGTGAFVVLGGKGVAERRFDTLAEAVQRSSAGDTVEVRGNGPFVSDGVTILQPLVIRAGAGFTPSITLAKASADRNVRLFNISAPLVLEGLELRRVNGASAKVENRDPTLLRAGESGSLHVANCRLIFKADSPLGYDGPVFLTSAKSISVRNSVLSGNISTDSACWFRESGARCTIDNCVLAIGGIQVGLADRDIRDVYFRVRGNTFVGNCLNVTLHSRPNLPDGGGANPPIRLELSGNILRWEMTMRNQGFLFFHQDYEGPFSTDQAEALLPRLVGLTEKQNVYRTGAPLLRLVANWQRLPGKRGRDLADWDRFWGQKDTGSVEGEIRFQGGDLVMRARSAPERITAEDFRLRSDSAGYRAGKDGKDLGADVDLVGPGPAYERWKKTPEYQQWLTDTGQVKK